MQAPEPSDGCAFRRSSSLDDLARARETLGATPTPATARLSRDTTGRGSALKLLVFTAAVGILLLAFGLGLGIAAFGQLFGERSPDPVWEGVADISVFLLACGFGLTVVSIIAAIVVGIRRLGRPD